MNMKQLFEIKMDKIVSISLSLCCYGCSIYMMFFLFCKYYDNEDSSKVAMKKYHDLPSGRYPSFTFCIYAKHGKLLKDEILRSEFGLTQNDYYQQLTGGLGATNMDITKINLDKVIRKIDDVLEEFQAEDFSFQEYNQWRFTMKQIRKSPLWSSYQDPLTNCFTYDTEYSSSVSHRQIVAEFNITKFKKLHGNSGRLYILAHYPGQLIRNIRTYMMSIRNWNGINSENNNNRIRIYFSGLTIMRLRENGVDPCDPNIIDDDAEWKKHATKTLGCMPPYWNNNSNHYLKPEKICNSKTDLDSIKAYWPKEDSVRAQQIFQNYTRPCNSFEQLIFNTDVSHYSESDILKVYIKLRNDKYQEVHNTKAFGIADLWANIGGYVGIFCGFSILQTTTYFIDSIKELIMDFRK